jgi:hypothetical protein
MPFALETILTALGVFAGMLALMEAGAHMGRKRLARDPEGARAGTAAAEICRVRLARAPGGVHVLGALTRFDARRALITEESNAIGTAWDRLELLPASAQPELRQGMRDYVDARLSVYQDVEDVPAVRASLARAAELKQSLWVKASAACRGESPAVMTVMMPALNAMFDIASERTAAAENHPPALVFFLLIGMALACALLAGLTWRRPRLPNGRTAWSLPAWCP